MNKNVKHVDDLEISPKPRHVSALIAVNGETGEVSQEEQSNGHGSVDCGTVAVAVAVLNELLVYLYILCKTNIQNVECSITISNLINRLRKYTLKKV